MSNCYIYFNIENYQDTFWKGYGNPDYESEFKLY